MFLMMAEFFTYFRIKEGSGNKLDNSAASNKRLREDNSNEQENGNPGLSKNKLKKLKRNPNKKFEPKTWKFEICKTCGNPKVWYLFLVLFFTCISQDPT